MASKEYYLVQVPQGVNTQQITNTKSVEELDKVCSRLTDTIEHDLKKRLFIFSEDREKWHAQPKIKRIYKYVVASKQQKKGKQEQKRNRKLRTLKKL